MSFVVCALLSLSGLDIAIALCVDAHLAINLSLEFEISAVGLDLARPSVRFGFDLSAAR